MSTTPTERRLAITPGDATIGKMGDHEYHTIPIYVAGDTKHPVCQVDGHDPEDLYSPLPMQVANATLYCDAHNTYNACGLTPSELLAKYQEAKELVARWHEAFDGQEDNKNVERLVRDSATLLNLPQ